MQTTFIGVGTCVGASIFVITGNAIEAAGPAIILTYLFGAFSKVPFYPLTTIVAIATTAIMIPMLSIEALVLGSVFAAAGIITLTLTKRIGKNRSPL